VAVESVFETGLGHLYQGDAMELLPLLDNDSVDAVFADPPFNLGKDYGNGLNDSLANHEYLAWCASWVAECVRLLKPGGAFWLWNLPKWNVEIGHRMNTLGMTFRHWVAVDIKYSLPIPGRLYPSHYSLLYYTKGKPKSFKRPRVPIPVCRHCGGDIKDYGGHRGKLNPGGLNLTDVWLDIPPVRHNSTKRRGANELSLKLLRRVLEISTEPGDLVLDPFGGSGTTYAAAEEMHRHWIGCELGDTEPIIRRLKGEQADVPPKLMGDAGKGMGRSAKRQAGAAVGSLWDEGDGRALSVVLDNDDFEQASPNGQGSPYRKVGDELRVIPDPVREVDGERTARDHEHTS
jgi:site-specific DNA-methyltransferase (adenine-specific)